MTILETFVKLRDDLKSWVTNNLNNKANISYVDEKFDSITEFDPTEIQEAIDANTAAIDTKVDKVDGKGLSTNDYTTAEKNKLASIEAEANFYEHPEHTSHDLGLYKVTVDDFGHVSGATLVDKDDIVALGIPAQNTVYDDSELSDRIGGVENDITTTNETLSGVSQEFESYKTTNNDAVSTNAANIDTLKGLVGNTKVTTQIENAIDALNLEDTYAPITHEHEMSEVSGLSDALAGKQPVGDYATKAQAKAYADAKDSVIANKSDIGHNHDTDYDAKGAADTALDSAKAYADSAATKVKNDLLNGAGAAYDTLKELGNLIVDNQDAIDALETVAAGKADKTHTHAISDVTNLQSALDGKADTSHGTHVSYSSTVPVMDGTASAGSATTVARSDHKHPTDTSRAAQSDLDTHTSNTTIHITSAERTNWNSAKTHADSAHAPSNAEKNQNAFSNIVVGSTTVAADIATDTVTFVGDNVTITPDATNDKITFAVANGSTSAAGILKLTNSTSSTSTTTAATPSSVKSAYDLANTAQSRADSAYNLADSKVGGLSDLGITATVTELNYMDGVTSNVQTQLDGKAASSHNHTITASASDDDVVVLTGTNGTNKVTYSASHANSGVTAGTYKSVTVNAKGHVTAGSNPTTLSGYGITDAASTSDLDNLSKTVSGKANTSDLTSHTGNKLNPHGVTLDQLGVTATAAELNALDGITATVTELNYVDGVTSSIQTQLNNKQGTISGAATTITDSNLTANRALVSNGSGKVAVSAVTSTELGYLDGVTSGVQSQLDAKVPTSRTVNGKALSANITLSASDVGADVGGSADTALVNAKAYTDAEITEWVGNKTVSEQITTAVAVKADADHTHDGRYYTESEIDNKLSGKSDSGHTHSAYVNQNAFSNVTVGSTTIAADAATDTLTLVAGSNVTLTPDATNDKITIAATDTVYTHPTYTAKSSGLYKVTVDGTGHVSGTAAVVKSDITALDIPAQDTTYSAATTSVAGLMSASDKAKLDGIATGANKITVDSALSSTSTNPVQNKVVNAAISNLNTLVGDTPIAEQVDTLINSIDNLVYVSEENQESAVVPLNADTFGGYTVDTLKSLFIDSIYPIGSIYTSVNSTSPAQLFGGTWTQLKDRFLLGAGDSYSNGTTGGSATHTLTEAQMPQHRHHWYFDAITTSYPVYSPPWTTYVNSDSWNQEEYEKTYFATGNTTYAGNGEAHNNMPPYLTVYMWKRTA